MGRALRILNIEDSRRDASLLRRHLEQEGYDLVFERVDSPAAMRAALQGQEWEVILSNYAMPHFGALQALAILKEMNLDIPFIIVSESIGEEPAVEAMLAGAHDYLMKDKLVRLAPALERQLKEAKNRKAERRAEENCRSIFENAVEGLFQTTPDGKFISVNSSLARIFGYESPEEFMRQCAGIELQPYAEPGRREELQRLLMQHDLVKGFECEVFRKDLTKIWVLENIRAIRDGNGVFVAFEGSVEDITGRKTLEEQLRQSQKMDAIAQLAGGIAHDFNNLLTVITGYSELIIADLQAGDPLLRRVEEIRKAAFRAATLTRQLLAFGHKQVVQPAALSLNSVISDLAKMLPRLIGEDVEFLTALEPELGTIKADPGQIEQVIMSLAVNARDAMPMGGKLIIETQNLELDDEYSREHVAIKPGPYAMLAVSDTGIGMDAKTQARIFEPFFTTKEPGKGSGLGLSTVYGIVKQSGGDIRVYSEVGRGTTLKIYFPRIGRLAPGYKHGPEFTETLRGTETILLTEDDAMVRTLTRSVLEKCGYRVLEAADPEAAIVIGEGYQEPIHLLMTDVVMPGMSGVDLSQRLIKLRREIKVLFTSGYTDKAVMHQGVVEKAAFIAKPFAPRTLALKVREILDKPGE